MKLLNKSLLSMLAIVSLLGLAACGEKKEEGTAGTAEQPAAGTTGSGTTTTP